METAVSVFASKPKPKTETAISVFNFQKEKINKNFGKN